MSAAYLHEILADTVDVRPLLQHRRWLRQYCLSVFPRNSVRHRVFEGLGQR